MMNLPYIKAIDILPGDTIAYSIKTEKDKYSKVKYMVVEETVEDEFDTGEAAVACHGQIYMQPSSKDQQVQLSTIRKQKLHLKEEATILLLNRVSIPKEEADITSLVPLFPLKKEGS